ncbi:hypothetical protein [Chryseobacterium sp. OSA05B]|uniref:hypothetical protein n=1 Tax=Chryseobacterium sp. OSA05B TaxID=2862650 RepID=UPI001CBD2779|nr:hypothetical protein [Chryseobacterium sp. OSA05B]
MKNTLVYKITSCLSILLATVYFYEVVSSFEGVKELFLEISSVALVVTIFVIINLLLSILLLTKKIKVKLILIIFQALIIIVTTWALYEIYSFEEITIIDSQIVS